MIFASLLVFLVAVEEPEAWEMADDGIGHSMAINLELRLCRLSGDNKDDNVCTDTEEIYSRSAVDPVPIASTRPRTLLAMLLALPCIGLVGGQTGSSDQPEPGSSSCHSTSKIQDDYERFLKTVNGKRVRYGAMCIHCRRQYYVLSSCGTDHLTRHRDKCVKRREKCRMV